ncbi:MAG: adenylate/guanylate cyclase domain-containing protein [Gordonia sp. (in: high G+C Gram-positive bacteria)]|uniref:adenylate/guanylate cyclase domain-containing protein n=1 Tax=Gordonia sp. (in: high G+C Gram-positive bacteria) TaxID=84139 RepID=UPI0039E2E72A
MSIPDNLRRCLPGSGSPTPAASVTQALRQRLVVRASYLSAAVAFGYTLVSALSPAPTEITLANLAIGVGLVLVPELHRLGTLAPAIAFVVVATVGICVLTVSLGTSTGLLFYFFSIAAATPMIVGIDRIAYPVAVLAVCVVTVCALHFAAPYSTGRSPDWLMSAGFVVNALTASCLSVYIMFLGIRQIRTAEAALEEQYDRSEALLDNILPRSVSQRLKDPTAGEIADTYDDASVLFADVVGFTAMSSRHTPTAVVHYLNELYLALDTLTDRYGLEKIKTTGDSYMVVSGVPVSRPDHLETLARFALEMHRVCERVPGPDGTPLPMRIGLACGPVVAGVVGSKKFFYDVWGDTVNVASRMESTGEPGRIQVTAAVRDRLADEFAFSERGIVAVKGKGEQQTWILIA